ncbi:MAG: calcium-binding protein [Silicimonas sp.]|nr:calcium-binding protein [Silicimonas sp.]
MKTSTAKIIAIAMMGLGATTAMAAGQGEVRERPTFESMDIDGDGEITTADLEAMRNERFASLDTDGDGSISEAEFVAKAQADAEERASAMFARLDADGDGMLSEDVLQSRSRGGNPGRMISRFDTDNSGGVSAEEFEAGMEKFAERRQKGGKKHGGGFGRN